MTAARTVAGLKATLTTRTRELAERDEQVGRATHIIQEQRGELAKRDHALAERAGAIDTLRMRLEGSIEDGKRGREDAAAALEARDEEIRAMAAERDQARVELQEQQTGGGDLLVRQLRTMISRMGDVVEYLGADANAARRGEVLVVGGEGPGSGTPTTPAMEREPGPPRSRVGRAPVHPAAAPTRVVGTADAVTRERRGRAGEEQR